MKFTAEEYYRAAVERMRQARAIHNSGANYALAMYVSGLAVECMLRAFRWRKDRSFEGRHDLEDLLKSSKLLTISDERVVLWLSKKK
jgi:HEPN domain-containing protein